MTSGQAKRLQSWNHLPGRTSNLYPWSEPRPPERMLGQAGHAFRRHSHAAASSAAHPVDGAPFRNLRPYPEGFDVTNAAAGARPARPARRGLPRAAGTAPPPSGFVGPPRRRGEGQPRRPGRRRPLPARRGRHGHRPPRRRRLRHGPASPAALRPRPHRLRGADRARRDCDREARNARGSSST